MANVIGNIRKLKIILILVVCCGLGLFFTLSQIKAQVSLEIELIADIKGGSGNWGDPYIIDTNIIRWRVITNGGNTSYRTWIEMSGYRSCANLMECGSGTNGTEFEWSGMAGKYQILARLPDGSGQVDVFVHCRVPPLASFNLPYTPPSTSGPSPKINILNSTGQGSGGYNDPIIVNGSVVKFNFDGSSDMVGGVLNWAINITEATMSAHPIYSGGQDIKNALDTFLIWDTEVDGKTFEWNTQERPSAINEFNFDVYAIDKDGNKFQKKVLRFKTNSGQSFQNCDCSEWITMGCGQGGCASNEVYRVRNCSPVGCQETTSCTRVSDIICSTLGAGEGSCNVITGTQGGLSQIKLVKTSNKTQVFSGDEITYFIGYNNVFSAVAKKVVIRDVIPINTDYVDGSANNGGVYNIGSNEIVWNLTDVLPAEHGTLTFRVIVLKVD